MIHAMTDVTSVTVSVENGGCGQSHDVVRDEMGRGTLTCATCEPRIIALNTGWGRQPHEVALTPDEIAVQDSLDQEAKRNQQRTWSDPIAFAKTMADAMRGHGAADLPSQSLSLLAQVAALSPEERAAFVTLMSATTPAIEAATQPIGADEDDLAPAALSTPVDKGVDVPVKRGPGRPRKHPLPLP